MTGARSHGRTRRHRFGKFGRAVLSLTLAASLTGCAAFSRDILYSPHRETVAAAWAHSPPQSVSVTTQDNITLPGYFWPGAPGDRDIFVFFHGRNWNVQISAEAAQHLVGAGNAVLVASYRGFGSNPGHPNEAGMMLDAAAFIAQARALTGPDARVWLIGHSIGSAVALHAAAQDPDVAGVIAMSAFVRVAAVAPKISRAFIPDRWNNLDALRTLKAPVLFVQGALDRLVPEDSAETLFAAYAGPSSLVIGATSRHNPDMTLLAPWLNGAIAAMQERSFTALPAPPTGWTEKGRRP